MTKLPVLTPDDPLRSGAPAAPTTPSPAADPAPEPEIPASGAIAGPKAGRAAAAPNGSAPQAATAAPAATPKRTRARDASKDQAAGEREEQEWSGSTDVTTVRVPVEVLRAMRVRSRDLGLPKGMILTAGMLDVLERSDDELVELVEATQLRYDRARRRASRTA